MKSRPLRKPRARKNEIRLAHEDFGKQVRRLRTKHGIDFEDLSTKCKKQGANLASIESGIARRITFSTMLFLAQELRAPLHVLLRDR